MRFDCETTTYIDERGHQVTNMHFIKIEEPGDREKEIECLKERANFESQYKCGNLWTRKLRAKEEYYESLKQEENTSVDLP